MLSHSPASSSDQGHHDDSATLLPPGGVGADNGALRSTASPTPSTIDYFPNPNIHNPTMLETSQFWAENTSIHGMYYMLERGHFRRWKTIAWTIIVLTCTGGLLWALIEEYNDFAQFNVDTATTTMIPSSMNFPRVTICNANEGISASWQNMTGIEEPRNEEELMAISQRLEDFILYTQFNDKVYEGRAGLENIWSPIITPLGACFSFATNENVFVPGISGGLTVYTWLDQETYPETTKWAGVRVFVTPNDDQGKMISHQTSSALLVAPGAVSYISTTLQSFQREEDEPWTTCIPTGTSIEQCRTECIMSATREKCDCRIMGDPSSILDYCNSTNAECTSSIGDEDLTLCKACSVPPCKEQVYGTRYSAGRISQNTAEFVKSLRNDATTTTSIKEDQLLFNNFALIHINYDAIRYAQTTETKSTSVSQLFSNLGGSFGFFMGISIISIVEFFVELVGLRLLLPKLFCGRGMLFGVGQKKFD